MNSEPHSNPRLEKLSFEWFKGGPVWVTSKLHGQKMGENLSNNPSQNLWEANRGLFALQDRRDVLRLSTLPYICVPINALRPRRKLWRGRRWVAAASRSRHYSVRATRSTSPRSQRCGGRSSSLRCQGIAVISVGVAEGMANTCPEIGSTMTAPGRNFISHIHV
jgi:hypothetical protein